MADRLRLRVLLYDCEPAHSLAARLATRQGESISRFLNTLQFKVRDLALGLGINRLAHLSSTDAKLLTANTAYSTGVGQSIKLCDEYLSWLDWSINPRRVCPACLFYDRANSDADGVEWAAWHRAWWDVKCIQICPVHACLLTSRCLDCGEQLNWSTTAIDHCSNGHLLASIPDERRLDAMADRYLCQRFNRLKTGTTNQLLDQLTVGNAAKVIDRLGAVADLHWSANVPVTSDQHLQAHRRALGFSMSLDVEHNFRSELDHVIANVPKENLGIIKNYGWIYQNWLRMPRADHSGGQLRTILRTHAADHGIIASEEQFPKANSLSLKTASAKIGKSRAYTRRVVFSQGLIPSGSRPGVAFLIDPTKLDRMQGHVATLVDSKTSAKLMGIDRAQFRLLVKDGLIVVDEKAKDFGFGRFFARADVQNFCKRLSSDVPVVTCPSPNALPLPAACRAAGVTISDACRAILGGTVVPDSHDPFKSGIAAIMLLPKDLNGLKKPRLRPVATVAAALDIHLQAASELIKAGGFGCPPDVSQASLALFKRRFAKPNDLSACLGGSGRSVVRILNAANIDAAFGPPKCRQLFYSRQAAFKILAKSLSRCCEA